MPIMFITGWIYLRFSSEGPFEIQTTVKQYDRKAHTIDVYDSCSRNNKATIKPPLHDSQDQTIFRYCASDKKERNVWICDPDFLWRDQTLSIDDLRNPSLFSKGQRIKFVIFHRAKKKYSHYPLTRKISFINPESSTINMEDNYSESGFSTIKRIQTTQKLERSCNLFILSVYKKGDQYSREYVSIFDPRDPLGEKILSCEDYDLWIISLQKRVRVDIPSPQWCIEERKIDPWQRRLDQISSRLNL